LNERGERVARDILAVPAVNRAAGRAAEVTGDLVVLAETVVDEAHDTVEEAYGRFYLLLDRVKHAVLPGWLRRDQD
jgi:hypothetical protein